MLIPLLVLLVVLFAGLMLALKFILNQHVTQATGHLQVMSQENLLAQEALKKKLEQTEKERQELQAKSKQEAQTLWEQSQREIEDIRRRAVEEAHHQAEQIMAQANQAKGSMLKEINSLVERQALERACELVQQILPQMLKASLQTEWLEQLLSDGLLKVERFNSSEAISTAKVTSAVALSAAQKERIQEKLKKALGEKIQLEEEVDPGLIAGLVIQVGHLVIDGSLASKLREHVRNAQYKAESAA